MIEKVAQELSETTKGRDGVMKNKETAQKMEMQVAV